MRVRHCETCSCREDEGARRNAAHVNAAESLAVIEAGEGPTAMHPCMGGSVSRPCGKWARTIVQEESLVPWRLCCDCARRLLAITPAHSVSVGAL